ncbi:MAG: FKBP-type peptidyl-prolyl cis-trans isomerase, partial [Eubacteriales bacterium]
MSKKEEAAVDNRSKSQIKREARQKEVLAAKKAAKKRKTIGYMIAFVLIALIAVAIGFTIYNTVNTTVASDDYSAQITDDGFIQDVDVASYISTIDFNNIVVPLADIEYADDLVEADIQTQLDTYPTLNTDMTRVAADGDTINLDYVGTIDGVEFDGGSTEGAGSDLVLGSDTFIDDFEDQLIGSIPGSTKTVVVTFPEDYSSEDLAGKEAEFTVTVNGIYDESVFNDTFVQTYLSAYADSAEGYRTYLKETNYATNLENYVIQLIVDGSSASSYPKDYINYVKALQKFSDYSSYESMNEMYSAYLGYEMYSKFSEYTGLSNNDYEASLTETAQTRFCTDAAYQYIYTQLGLSITDEQYETFCTNVGEDAEATYGKG